MKKLIIATAISEGVIANVQAASRDTISVVSSSTVYPIATVVCNGYQLGGRHDDKFIIRIFYRVLANSLASLIAISTLRGVTQSPI